MGTARRFSNSVEVLNQYRSERRPAWRGFRRLAESEVYLSRPLSERGAQLTK